MKILEAIKKGFEFAGKNMGLVLIVFIFNLIWNWGVIPFAPETPEIGVGPGVALSPALTILSVIFILVSIFIQGGVLGSIKDALKEGQMQLARFAGYGAKFYLRLLALAIIIISIIGVVGFLATLIVAASAPTGNVAIIAITSIVALIIGAIGVYLVILLFLAPYIAVVEDTGVFQAMRTSIDFVRKILLKIIGLGLMLFLIGLGVGLVMGLIAGLLSLAIKGRFLQVMTGFINGGVNAYLSIVVTSCIIIYYLAMKGGQPKETPQA